MPNTTISPNMGMPVPVTGVDPGPDWANNVNASLSIVDSHNHTTGQGVQITPAGININSDLSFGGFNGTNYRSVRMTAQGSPLPASSPDLGCIYVSGADLYYNDENGNQIRITQSGSVSGSAGTITGLPSGTASAAYSGGTFTFQGATNTPATMAVGPLVVGNAVPSAKTVTIAPANGIASNYNFTLPAALPGSTLPLTLDTSGNVATASASININTPTFAGTASGTITAGTYSPTVTVSSGSNLTVRTFFFNRINNIVSVNGTISIQNNGSGQVTVNCTLPINPSGNFANTYDATGCICGYFNISSATIFGPVVTAAAGTQTVLVSCSGLGANVVNSNLNITFTYSCA